MVSYQPLNLQDLEVAQLEAFLPFIVPQAQETFLEKIKEGDFALAIAAYQNSDLIGFVFGNAYPIIQQGFIRSIFVVEKMRQKGIGTSLIQQIMNLFQQRGISLIQLSFYTNEPYFEPISKILENLHWKPPQVVVDRYHFYAPIFQPEWYIAETPILYKNLKISPWQYLNEKHLTHIRKMVSKNPIMEDLSPFNDSLPIDKNSSLVLKKKNEIVGWMITHRYDIDTIRYSALYVDRNLRGHGPAICLLKEAIRRQKLSSVMNAFTEINYKRTPAYWQQFVKKRLAPNATRKDSLLNFYYYNASIA